MFKLNKIHAHIKIQKLQELKLTRYKEEELRREVPNPVRIKDIERALHRVTENIKMWEEKIKLFQNAPPREPTRPPMLNGPDEPLIG